MFEILINKTRQNYRDESPDCENSQYTNWINSEFGDCERQDVQFHNDIEYVEIKIDGFDRTWPSCADFIKWEGN